MSCITCIACLALRADRQDKDGIQRNHVSVEGNISVSALANDQFTHIMARQPADQRIVRQHVRCADDLARTLLDMLGFVLFQMADAAP
ncbi:hypothetical protein ACP93_09765 [Xanthomonas sp. NCPPB 1128]|nr:hypothetical protein ACP93_09765 [Xanthomonas sp. NCPPB 1128]